MVVRPSALQRGGDKNAPAATFGAYLCAVRTMLRIVRIQHCKRLKGVCQGGTSPLTLFCFLLQEQKEGPAGEAYKLSPLGDSAAPKAITNYPPPGRRANYAFAKDSAPPTGNKNLDLKSLLPAFSHRKIPSPGGVQIKTLYKILRRRQATTNRPPRQRCSPSFAQGSTPPKATAILPQIKFFSPLFFIEK